jgi:hypothetical protein
VQDDSLHHLAWEAPPKKSPNQLNIGRFNGEQAEIVAARIASIHFQEFTQMNRTFTLLTIAGLAIISPTLINTTIEPAAAQQITGEFAKLDLYTSEYRSSAKGYTEHSVKLNLRSRANVERLLTAIERADIREIEIIDTRNNAYSVTEVQAENELLYKPFKSYNSILTIPLKFRTPMGIRVTRLRITPTKGNPIEIKI